MRKLFLSLLHLTLTVWMTLDASTDSSHYNYDQCVSMALEENTRIKTSRNNITMAVLRQREAFTAYLPQMSLSGNALTANRHLIEMQMQFPPQMQIPPQAIRLAKSGLTANASAMVPVYAGGRIYNTNRMARIGTEIENLNLTCSENEVRMTVARYYWQIMLLKDKIKTVRAMSAALDVMYDNAEAAFNAGIATRNDMLQVDLKKNEMAAVSLELNNDIDVLRMLLAQYMGLPDYNSFDIPDPAEGETSITEPPASLHVNHDMALPTTAEYQLLNKKIDAAKITRHLTLSESLPTLAVGGGWFFNNLLDKSKNSWMAMITISIPISWKTSYSLNREKIAISNAILELADGSERLVIGMSKSYNDLELAFKNIAIATKSITQAEENLRMHEDFYRAGTATISDLLQAQALYRQSRDRYSEAISAYEIRKIEYLVRTGR